MFSEFVIYYSIVPAVFTNKNVDPRYYKSLFNLCNTIVYRLQYNI